MPNYFVERRPQWFEYTCEYLWLLEHQLVDLEPWFLLERDDLEWYSGQIAELYTDYEAIPFAKRQDNDDVACWIKGESGIVQIIHVNASPGWEKRNKYSDFWAWFHQAIDDMILFQQCNSTTIN